MNYQLTQQVIFLKIFLFSLLILGCDQSITRDDSLVPEDAIVAQKRGGKARPTPTDPVDPPIVLPIISASSFESDAHAPEAAFDGSFDTRWSSGFSDNEWIQKDFGKSITFSKVTLYWESAYGSAYEVRVSDNGIDWRTVYVETSGNGGEDVITLPAVTARYIQMYGQKRATEWGYSLFEFTVEEGTVVTPECYSDRECNDGSSCTDDICQAGTCVEIENGSCQISCNTEENLITNCDFSEGLNGWATDLFFNQTLGNQSVTNGALNIAIVDGGNSSWEIQPRQENLSLAQGKEYELSFVAWAVAPRTIDVSVTMNRPDWASYSGTKNVTLTTVRKTFSYIFTMNAPSDSDTKLEFKVGGSSDIDVYIDDVSLVAVGGVESTPTCYDGIQNGAEVGVDCGGSCAACQMPNRGFYVGDGGQSLTSYNQLLSQGRTADAQRIARIAFAPQARWFGDWNSVRSVRGSVDALLDAAEREGTNAVMVTYAIPARDCDAWSSGGLSATEYIPWVREIAGAIQGRTPWIIIEPDAMAMLGSCEQGDRVGLIQEATRILKASGARVYLDIGTSNWHSESRRIEFINMIGAENLTGFASNVSNFIATGIERAANDRIAAATGLKYVIDTSRNGNGSNGEWCNPRGRSIGEYPEAVFSGALDAYLWVKRPGESDGECNGGPVAGMWWLNYALELTQ